MSKRLEILSFGGGVQSTALALLIEQGKLPKPDYIMWADTGDEPEAVYEHIMRWKPRLERLSGFIILKRTGRYPRLGDMVIKKALTSSGSNTLPYFLKNPNGGEPQLVRRGCTYNYKSHPLHQRSKRLVKEHGAEGYRHWLGISWDERQRMKADAWHPLIEEFDGRLRNPPLSRRDCHSIINNAGETAPRSSCVFCPFRTREEWAHLSEKDRARVAEVDAALEAGFALHGKHGTLKDRPYLRPDLRAVDGDEWFDGAEDTQLALSWDNECAGICGV